jgi:methionyl-tRNA synthetase
MATNLFISYDLMAPGQHYDQVIEAIKQTGNWAKIEYSLFYVSTEMTTTAVTNHVWRSMTPNDKLIVIDTSNNNSHSFNIDHNVFEFMRSNWNR